MGNRVDKTRRRQEHEARVAEWQKLSPKEQILELRKRRGESKKQIARLMKKVKP